MYEELQRKTRPKAPRCVLADGIKGLLGIVSPSKLLYEQCRIDGQGEEVRRYLEENRKYLLYRRQLSRQQWKAVYREYRRQQNPERAEAWERERQEAAAEALRSVRLLIEGIGEERGKGMGRSIGKIDLESISVEQVEQFHKWLTGEENTEEVRCKTQPHLTGEEAFSVIYYLQEVLEILPDTYELCRECGRIFDSDEEGTWIGEDAEGHTEETYGNYCEDCIPVPDSETEG